MVIVTMTSANSSYSFHLIGSFQSKSCIPDCHRLSHISFPKKKNYLRERHETQLLHNLNRFASKFKAIKRKFTDFWGNEFTLRKQFRLKVLNPLVACLQWRNAIIVHFRISINISTSYRYNLILGFLLVQSSPRHICRINSNYFDCSTFVWSF